MAGGRAGGPRPEPIRAPNHMPGACYDAKAMSKMIQIRNVPDDIHKKLKIRAAKEGLSLSDLLLREATRLTETPAIDEFTERLRQQPPWPDAITAETVVEIIREARGPVGPE